jgi:hypothetical protein
MNKILNSHINNNLTPIIGSYLLPIPIYDKYQKELKKFTGYVKYSLDYKIMISENFIPQFYYNCNKMKYKRAIDEYWEIVLKTDF